MLQACQFRILACSVSLLVLPAFLAYAQSSQELAATVDFPGEGFDVAVAGGFAYVAAGSGGLVVLDVATPGSPEVVGSVSTGNPALGVAVAAGRAYVVNGSALRIIDVSDSAAPVLLAVLALPGRPRPAIHSCQLRGDPGRARRVRALRT